MNCFVYRSKRHKGMYLYLSEKDNIDIIPKSLRTLLGDIEFSFKFDLDKNRKLMQSEAKEVIELMQENGYFLQMPPPKDECLGRKAT